MKTLKKKFWQKVDKRGPDECWNWTASKVGKYGAIRLGTKSLLAHRASWEIHNGPIPDGDHHGTTCVCHKCDNTICCNPSHLFLGSHKDNMQDRDNKGRNINHVGEKHGCSKLKAIQIPYIRALYSAKVFNTVQLAKIYSVTAATISLIVNRKTWSHI